MAKTQKGGKKPVSRAPSQTARAAAPANKAPARNMPKKTLQNKKNILNNNKNHPLQKPANMPAANRPKPPAAPDSGLTKPKKKLKNPIKRLRFLKDKPKTQKNAAQKPQNGANSQNNAILRNNGQAPQKPAAPVSQNARRAADNAVRSKPSVAKRRPYRGGNYSLYFVLGGIIVVVVMIILANTVLFKCNGIEISGNVRYTAEEIAAETGICYGDNLLHIDSKAVENRVLSAFSHLDGVTVKKSFPTRVSVTVTEAENWYALEQDEMISIISRGGRVLGAGAYDGLIVVKGYEAESLEPGRWLRSAVDGKTNIPEEIFAAAAKTGLENINEIDITDRFSVKITVDNRIILNLGPATDVESKLYVAQALIKNELGEDEQVTILLSNPEKAAVQNNGPSGAPAQNLKPHPLPIFSEETSSDDSDEEDPEESSDEESSDEEDPETPDDDDSVPDDPDPDEEPYAEDPDEDQ